MTSPNEAGSGNGPILIVDDDEDTRECLRDLLEGEGYEVAEAGHGEEALEVLAAGMRPCLILLDLMMPVMTGFEVLEALRRAPDLAATPVVVISAWPERAAQAKGAQGFLKKPLNLTELFKFSRSYCTLEKQSR